jgi:endonuclease/exonuclease/phosphatase family metal-dependent hydrolase
MQLKILSFNIHGGYDRKGYRDLRRVHRLMENLAIDVGVFQEMETRASRGGALGDIVLLAGPERSNHLPGLALKEGEGWYGNLVVSRYPIVRGIVHDLSSASFYEPRNAVDALIDSPLGLVRIIGTHLSLTPWERLSEMKKLVSMIDKVEEKEKNPLLLMGDINEWWPKSRLLGHLNKLMVPVFCGASFPSLRPFLRLDRVWQAHCPYVVTAQTVHIKDISYLSDHLPVLITVTSA